MCQVDTSVFLFVVSKIFRAFTTAILAQGPICVPFSMMGRRKKTADPSFATHVSFFENIAVDQDCNIIENVTEYDEQIVKDALPAFSVTAVKVDPRVFGLGVARARIYIIAIRRSKLRWKPGFCLEDFMDSVTAQVTLQSTDYFWKKLPPQNLSRSDDTRLQNDGMKTFTFQGFQGVLGGMG